MKKKLYTQSEYAKKIGVSRQAIGNSKPYLEKTIELTVFVEFEGQKIEIEKRKFIVD